MFDFEFYSPWFLLLFLLFIPLIIKDAGKEKKRYKSPYHKKYGDKQHTRRSFLLKISKYIILSALIIAMARPRTFTVSQDRDDTKGVDIMLSIDVSLSMLAKDLNPDRITALKDIALNLFRSAPMTG
jgi:Ca-activated chloride channel family protein